MKVCIGISFSGLNYELYLTQDPTVLLIWKKKNQQTMNTLVTFRHLAQFSHLKVSNAHFEILIRYSSCIQ